MSRNIILAGVPRSGSTLTCHLLNKIPNTVALHEPIEPGLVPVASEAEMLAYIEAFFAQQRTSVINRGSAKSRSMAGKVPDNHIGTFDKKTGKREFLLDGNEINIDNISDNDFLLLIKQLAV